MPSHRRSSESGQAASMEPAGNHVNSSPAAADKRRSIPLPSLETASRCSAVHTLSLDTAKLLWGFHTATRIPPQVFQGSKSGMVVAYLGMVYAMLSIRVLGMHGINSAYMSLTSRPCLGGLSERRLLLQGRRMEDNHVHYSLFQRRKGKGELLSCSAHARVDKT